jgi:cyclic pyranopterin phosphate synthase
MTMSDRPTHLDEAGRARMVDVADKPATAREAAASGRVRMSREAFVLATSGQAPKGDIRAVAEIAGVMAGKRAAGLIPLCHPLALAKLAVEVTPNTDSSCFIVTASAKTTGPTGVEMEALTAVSVACLTIYDMLKSIDREMIIDDVKLMAKSGGKSGDYRRSET